MPRSVPRAPDIRFKVEPGDVPAEKVARRLHLTLPQFEACKTRLFMRGFPRPDEDTGMYCLEAVDRWRLHRHPSQFPELTDAASAVSGALPKKSLGAMAREGHERRQTQERRGHG